MQTYPVDYHMRQWNAANAHNLQAEGIFPWKITLTIFGSHNDFNSESSDIITTVRCGRSSQHMVCLHYKLMNKSLLLGGPRGMTNFTAMFQNVAS